MILEKVKFFGLVHRPQIQSLSNLKMKHFWPKNLNLRIEK